MGMDSVELVLDFEQTFDIEIPNAVAEAMMTPRDVQDFVVAEYQRLGRYANPDAIFETIRQVTAHITALEPEKISLDSRFVEDLKID